MKNWLANNWLYIAGLAVGAMGGFLYWKFVGCTSGTCAITSKPVNSTVYFSIMGALLFGTFKRTQKADNTKTGQ